MSWLTTKHFGRLTAEEAVTELKHLLSTCDSKKVFRQECKHRFGGPMMNVIWTSLSRVASICFRQNGSNMNVYASVTVH